MPPLSDIAQRLKVGYFFGDVAKDARILEIGSGTGWLGRHLKDAGWANYTGIDLQPPADFVGDIRDWRQLGLAATTFDVIVAFEVFEHVHCFQECFDLLKRGGLLMFTTPVPHMDWLLRALELIGLNQSRRSPHDRLFYLRDVPLFEPVRTRV